MSVYVDVYDYVVMRISILFLLWLYQKSDPTKCVYRRILGFGYLHPVFTRKSLSVYL